MLTFLTLGVSCDSLFILRLQVAIVKFDSWLMSVEEIIKVRWMLHFFLLSGKLSKFVLAFLTRWLAEALR